VAAHPASNGTAAAIHIHECDAALVLTSGVSGKSEVGGGTVSAADGCETAPAVCSKIRLAPHQNLDSFSSKAQR